MRFRSSFSRLISSCLTIGSGGSAGPEAPIVMSGSAIGSNIDRLLGLNDRQRVTLVGCGAAGAISAIFNAPIAGLIFAMEIILGEWAASNLIPIAIAAVAGTEISHLLQGKQIPFSHHHFNIGAVDIVACIGLAVFTALASIMLTRAIRTIHHHAGGIQLPSWLKAAGGGCAVGLIGLYLPMVLGEGYHAIREMMEGRFAPGIGLVFLAVLAKIMATALTLGSGGSGGIFAPCLVIGSFAGLTYHRALAYLWPGVDWVQEGCFVLLGMAGLVSGILQAPLTGIFLIVEITGGYEVILPLIIVSAISTTICHYMEPASFYLKDLVEKGQLMRPGTDARVLLQLLRGQPRRGSQAERLQAFYGPQARGYDAFRERAGDHPLQFVSANIVRGDTGKPVFPPSVVVEARSPDGKHIAYTLAVPRIPFTDDEDGGGWTELHVVDRKGKSRPFVTGKVNISNPKKPIPPQLSIQEQRTHPTI